MVYIYFVIRMWISVQSSKEQESDYCSQAPHVDKYSKYILNISAFAIFRNKINYIYHF